VFGLVFATLVWFLGFLETATTTAGEGIARFFWETKALNPLLELQGNSTRFDSVFGGEPGIDLICLFVCIWDLSWWKKNCVVGSYHHPKQLQQW